VTLRIDHVVYATHDLEEAATRFRDAFGLVTTPGGTHPRWGTANRIAPLGEARYVELIAIVDPEVAATTDIGRAIAERVEDGDRWFALCLADDAIDDTAARLGLEVTPGSRVRPDGREVTWRGAGIDDVRRTVDLPFFITWEGPADVHPGAVAAEHPSGARDVAWVEIAGDPERFGAWTQEASLPVRFVEDDRGITGVALATPGGDLVVR
jgi:catechol 2,3-dioxygenase-like lactoylglutathione lyase family enzyme